MSLSAAPARPGCGCGGRGGCGCGDCGPATADLAATAFVRPRFFAGQLLTEDDLGALTAYVTAKDRLHTRYLFGAGVVCGLWVSCDPCGGGRVTVQPGYALDCCGNDLVLACPASLDVNAMIRDLRAARLGKDCGDPCADQGAEAGQDTKPAGRQTAAPTRHYLLYARYGEQDTDLVAPYATEEPCGQAACEPSRIREGTSFILKCPRDTPPPDDLWCRLRACQPDQDILRRVARLEAYGRRMAAAADAEEHPPSFSPDDATELTKVRADLAGARKEAGQVRSATEYVRKLAAAVARYDLARDRAEYEDIAGARSELHAAAEALAGADAAAAYDPADRTAVNALLSQASQLADPSAQLPGPELAMLAQGRPADDSVLAELTSDVAAVQEWLLARLDGDPALADCELRSLVQAVSATPSAKQEASSLRSAGLAGSRLAELFTRTVTDCLCAAVNPPCAPCEDTDVLLACLEVRDCEVVRVCNADRDYSISGSALRYWLPTGLLHEVVEALCCLPERGKPAKAEPRQLTFDEAGLGIGESAARVPWQLPGLAEPAKLLREAADRLWAGRTARAVPRPPQAGPAAGQAGDTGQQVTALTERVAALTERLTQAEAKLGQTQADLSQAQADLSALASAPPATTGPASTGRRGTGAKRGGDAGQPAAAPPPEEASDGT